MKVTKGKRKSWIGLSSLRICVCDSAFGLGVGLLAKRPGFFRKIRQATKVGSDGSARIPRDPRLLELLEVLELLHRLQRKGEVSILRETCPECEPGCSLLPDCLPEK